MQKLKMASTVNERYSEKFQGHRISLTWVINKWFLNTNPMTINLLNVNNRITRTRFEVCSKLAIKTPKQTLWFL